MDTSMLKCSSTYYWSLSFKEGTSGSSGVGHTPNVSVKNVLENFAR